MSECRAAGAAADSHQVREDLAHHAKQQAAPSRREERETPVEWILLVSAFADLAQPPGFVVAD